jgi:hypothetical protein
MINTNHISVVYPRHAEDDSGCSIEMSDGEVINADETFAEISMLLCGDANA